MDQPDVNERVLVGRWREGLEDMDMRARLGWSDVIQMCFPRRRPLYLLARSSHNGGSGQGA